MAADRVRNQHIAATLKVSRPTGQLWRERFLALRVAGLEHDAPRPGRKPRISARTLRAVVKATVHTTRKARGLMKIALTVGLVLTLTACAPTTTWKSFARPNTPDAQRDEDWQECHHRYINKASYLNMGWLLAETVGHEPKIRACMFEKGYDTRQVMQ